MCPAYTHWAHWSHLLSVLPMYPVCAWWIFGSLSPVSSEMPFRASRALFRCLYILRHGPGRDSGLGI